MSCTQRVSPFCRMIHASSTWPLHFCHHSSWTFCKAVHQPDDAHKSTFLQICNHSFGLVEQAFWRMPLFKEWIGASSWDVNLAGASRHSTTGTLASGTSDSRCSSFTLSVAWKNSVTDSGVSFFCRFIDIVTETAIVSFRTLHVGFPIAKCLQVLDHGVFHIFRFWPQNSCFVNLARYFWIPLSSICENQDLFSSDESPYCTFPIRSWVAPSKMSSDGIFVIDNKIPSHFESTSWISSFRRTLVNRSAQFSTESLPPVTPKYS